MNPWDLSASDLLVWGIVLHLIADWPLQNDWMANHKFLKRKRTTRGMGNMGEVDLIQEGSWWDRHPAAYVHAGIHGILLALIFGWVAVPLAVVHLIIDCRWVVMKWAKLLKQTPPKNPKFADSVVDRKQYVVLLDIGGEVRIWVDQVFHIFCIAVAALLVTL